MVQMLIGRGSSRQPKARASSQTDSVQLSPTFAAAVCFLVILELIST